MPSQKSTVGRRTFLKGSGALAGAAVLGTLPNRIFAQGTARTEVVFASAPFFTKAAITQLVNAYNLSQTAVHATYLELPPAGDGVALHDDLLKRLRAKTGAPDLYSLDVVQVAEFAAAGHTLPLASYFDAAAMQAFFPGIVQGCTVAGKLMALPWFADCGMLFYRTDLLEKAGAGGPPQTWDELTAMATKALGPETPHGFLWQGKKSEALVCNLVSVIGSNGGAVLAPDGVTVRIAEPAAVAAVQMLYDMINRTRISPKEVLTWDEEPTRKPFNEGQAVFHRNWSYVWGLAQQSDSKVAGRIGVAPLPHFAGKASAASLGGFQYAVNAATKNKNATVDFLRWLSSAQTQLTFANGSGLAPTRRVLFDDPALAKTQPFLSQLKDVFVSATARPVTAKYPKVTLAIQSEVAAALASGKISAGLAAAKTKIEAALKA